MFRTAFAGVHRDGSAARQRRTADPGPCKLDVRALVFYKLSQRHFTRGSKSGEDVTLVVGRNFFC
jgi:hypothetical protein